MPKVKIGIIADDFTGASDAASFLALNFKRVVIYTNVPTKIAENDEIDAIVIALKSRSVEPEKALAMCAKAVSFLQEFECEKVYFKYCSTFDCTPKGNIGRVLDFLLDYYNESYTIICPSLPINGRIVKEGKIYVDGIELHHGYMAHHPLNPMWDSHIPTLMKQQSKYPCYAINKDKMKNIDETITTIKKCSDKFYLVPDYSNNEEGKAIAEKFSNLRLLSGGSGLLEFLENDGTISRNDSVLKPEYLKSIILCGSCSQMTRKQVEYYVNLGEKAYKISNEMLLNKEKAVAELFGLISSGDGASLVYSFDDENVTNNDVVKSKIIEEIFAKTAQLLVNSGWNNIVVAGGETAGAITLELGYSAFYVGETIDPGVPALYPVSDSNVRVILKSGNFGALDFFSKAV